MTDTIAITSTKITPPAIPPSNETLEEEFSSVSLVACGSFADVENEITGELLLLVACVVVEIPLAVEISVVVVVDISFVVMGMAALQIINRIQRLTMHDNEYYYQLHIWLSNTMHVNMVQLYMVLA